MMDKEYAKLTAGTVAWVILVGAWGWMSIYIHPLYGLFGGLFLGAQVPNIRKCWRLAIDIRKLERR